MLNQTKTKLKVTTWSTCSKEKSTEGALKTWKKYCKSEDNASHKFVLWSGYGAV